MPSPVPAPKKRKKPQNVVPRPAPAPKVAKKPPVVRAPGGREAPSAASSRPPKPPAVANPLATLTDQQMRHQADAYAAQVMRAGLAGVPSVQNITQQVTAFPNRQIQDVGGMSSALLNQLRGTQTYTADATGGLVAQQVGDEARIAQQANAAAIAAGGQAAAMPSGAPTLGAYGATAANAIAQSLPAVASSQNLYAQAIQQKTNDELQQRLAERSQQVAEINAQRPSIFGDIYQKLADRNFQKAVAGQNYQLALGELAGKEGAAAVDAKVTGLKLGETVRHNKRQEALRAESNKIAADKAKAAGKTAKKQNTTGYSSAWAKAQKAVDDAYTGEKTGGGKKVTGYKVSYYELVNKPDPNKPGGTIKVRVLRNRTVGPDWQFPPASTSQAKQAIYGETPSKTAGRSYYSGVNQAIAIMKNARDLYGWELSDGDITRLVQQYANPKFGGKYGAPGGKKTSTTETSPSKSRGPGAR